MIYDLIVSSRHGDQEGEVTMMENPNRADPSVGKSFQEAFIVPEEDAGIVLRTLRNIYEIRNGGEDKALFAALLRAQGGEAQAELFEYLDRLPSHEIERVMAQMERRIQDSPSAA